MMYYWNKNNELTERTAALCVDLGGTSQNQNSQAKVDLNVGCLYSLPNQNVGSSNL